MGVIDFQPSSDVGVLYLTEADLVGGYSYKGRLLKFAKVFVKLFQWVEVRCFSILPLSMLQILETKRYLSFIQPLHSLLANLLSGWQLTINK